MSGNFVRSIRPAGDIEASRRPIARDENLFALHTKRTRQARSVRPGRYRRRVRTRSELGQRGEDIAAAYLSRRGWTILGRNVRCGRTGEIDIVARRSGILAFVEVKTRSSARFGTPGEAVTWRKQARIRAMARQYLATARPHASAIRFDVVEVRPGPVVTHLEGCF